MKQLKAGETGGTPLHVLMFEVITRPTIYEQIVEDLVKFIPESHTQGAPLREALKKLRGINMSLVVRKRDPHSVCKMFEQEYPNLEKVCPSSPQ